MRRKPIPCDTTRERNQALLDALDALPESENARCTKVATTRRKDFRFKNNNIVDVWIPLCAPCARRWDEGVAEAEAEARVS